MVATLEVELPHILAHIVAVAAAAEAVGDVVINIAIIDQRPGPFEILSVRMTQQVPLSLRPQGPGTIQNV